MHLQINGCYWVISQAGLSSSSDEAFSEVSAGGDGWGAAAERSSAVAVCQALQHSWDKEEIWALPDAVWASSQPRTHITSLLLSLMPVCPHTESVHGEKYPNRTKEKSVLLCWFSSFTIMWGLLCATGTSTKTGQQRIWLGTAADRGRRTAHKITHQRALYEPAQTVNEWGSYSPLPKPSSFRLSNCKAFLQLTSGFILTRAVLENSWASFSFKPEKATLTAQQPWQHLKLELLQRLMLSEGTRQQIKRVPSLQKRRRRGNGPWPVSCYVDGHLSNCASRDGAELESLGLCTDRTQNGHEAEHVTLKPIRTHANKYRWMALFFFLLK